MRHLPLLLGLLLFACPVRAHDMNHPDLDGWYDSLYRLDGGWCCNKEDCKVTEYRLADDGYEVLIDDRFPGVTSASWHKVPPANVVARENHDRISRGVLVRGRGALLRSSGPLLSSCGAGNDLRPGKEIIRHAVVSGQSVRRERRSAAAARQR